ncbi:hypothetical protein SAMN05444359_106195 [Neolewinella agarilytica]|uniref:Uncharacterized protein n=1 Tax=Neolewinella agarilytica TaxID=478744 RepID=A0A1H9E052_9BACT|nr:hypothetical protein SAMN05444359_106195 [Neolewinella agarilytica]
MQVQSFLSGKQRGDKDGLCKAGIKKLFEDYNA